MTTPTKTEKDVDVIRTINVHDEIAKAFEAGRKAEREAVAAQFARRLAIYDFKRAKANASNRWEPVYDRVEAIQYVVEAIEILALDCGFGEIERGDHLPPTTKE